MAHLYHIYAILLLLLIWKASAYPHSWFEQSSLDPPPGIRKRSVNPTLALENNTRHSLSGMMHCYEPKAGRSTTSVNGCRPTLNYIRTFPKYRVIQDFLEGWWPKEPSIPPYAIHLEAGDCAIKIASYDARVPDMFSFEQVRQLATDILTDCESKGGVGGIANIGRGRGWTVAVIGSTEPGLTSLELNSTSVREE